MAISKNTYIRHKKRPEWGLGKVTQVLSPEKFRAYFIKGGSKLLIHNPAYILIENEIYSHPILDSINFSEAKNHKAFSNKKTPTPKKTKRRKKTQRVKKRKTKSSFLEKLLTSFFKGLINEIFKGFGRL